LRKILSSSPPDITVMNNEFGGADAGQSLRQRFINSMNVIKHGFADQADCDWLKLKSVSLPIYFFHGDSHPIYRLNDVFTLAETLGNIRVFPIRNCGMCCYFEHFKTLVNLTDDIAANRELRVHMDVCPELNSQVTTH